MREALVALKSPLGNIPAFRAQLQALLENEDTREQLIQNWVSPFRNNFHRRIFSMSVKEEIAPVSASQTAAPPSLLDEIMAQTRVQPKSESYDITRQGVSAFIAAMLQGDSSAEPINIGR